MKLYTHSPYALFIARNVLAHFDLL